MSVPGCRETCHSETLLWVWSCEHPFQGRLDSNSVVPFRLLELDFSPYNFWISTRKITPFILCFGKSKQTKNTPQKTNENKKTTVPLLCLPWFFAILLLSKDSFLHSRDLLSPILILAWLRRLLKQNYTNRLKEK